MNYVKEQPLSLYIGETLRERLKWVVFEANGEALWARIRENVEAIMLYLFRQGAFAGNSPQEAYYVKCDGETTTQSEIDNGIVNIQVGFVPLNPAEFVVVRIQQKTGLGEG